MLGARNNIELKLKQMYDAHFCCDGKCECFNACCNTMQFAAESSIICNRNLKIGKRYGEKAKILFIGKENKNRSAGLTPAEPESFLTQKNQHYNRTRFILSALLGECDEDAVSKYDGYAFASPNDDTLHRYFALTNHYHCVFKQKADARKYHGIKANNTMWYNCVEIVRKEIEILEADVIVIQSGWSVKENALTDIKKYFNGKWDLRKTQFVGLYKAKNTESGRICYIIGSYHPSFHLWHQDQYLAPLKTCILETRKMLNGEE